MVAVAQLLGAGDTGEGRMAANTVGDFMHLWDGQWITPTDRRSTISTHTHTSPNLFPTTFRGRSAPSSTSCWRAAPSSS